MADAIRRVRGRQYKVMQSVGLYPTAGASDDYAYSRHQVDRRKGKNYDAVRFGRFKRSGVVLQL